MKDALTAAGVSFGIAAGGGSGLIFAVWLWRLVLG